MITYLFIYVLCPDWSYMGTDISHNFALDTKDLCVELYLNFLKVKNK